MRFEQHKIINQLNNTLCEAAEYMLANNTSTLAGECMQLIIQVIETLKKEPGCIEDNSLLQDMTTAIELLSNPSELNFRKFSDVAKTINQKSKTGIKYKLRIAIIAELSGKWDALDSLYKALKNRDDCEVDVVMQPIFRAVKYPDGSVKTDVIYKDYLTAMGIDFYTYEEYSINKAKPDITIISQPYEGCTIDEYWPENISKYSKLVYSPYFTPITLNKECSTTFDSCFKLNYQKYAWKIICQSDRMLENFKEYTSRNGKNIIVTGLPKWDFPFQINKNNIDIPDEWKNKLEGKKVFLWNTHFTEAYGSKIVTNGRKFLEIFKKNKDIALIWRPHPMTNTIFKLYNTNEADEYEYLRKTVMESDNMVLDENDSYAEAFVYSDALITDFSSIISQYLFMGKPMLLLTSEPYEEARKKYDNSGGLFDFSKIPFADTIDKQLEFINAVAEGIDTWKDDRKSLIDTFYYYADGKCGERCAEQLIHDFKNEFEE